MNKTGIVKDDRYLNHKTGSFHPESHQRLEAIYDMLKEPDVGTISRSPDEAG